MGREVLHSFILVLAIAFAFLFAKSPFAQYDVQLAGGLFIALVLIKRFVKMSSTFEAIIFTLIIFIMVNTTGGLESPFFFLIYFLLFALALLLEPIESIVTTLGTVLFFLLLLPRDTSWEKLLPLLSLTLLTPFAMFMGEQYLKSEKMKAKSEEMERDTFFFLSLMVKNQLKMIKDAVENFVGERQLGEIKKSAQKIEKMIEKFEKTT